MGKMLRLLFLILLSVGLAACGSNNNKSDSQLKKTVFETGDQGGSSSIITIYSDGDDVKKQVTQNILKFKELGYTKEQAKQAIESQNSKYKKKIKGYNYDVTYDKEKATETLKVDFRKFDFKKGKDILETSGDPEKGVSLKTTKEMLEAAGFKERSK